MGNKDDGSESAYQGPAARAPDTDDGLYPDAEGDLGHKKGGDTEPLPGNNAPLAPGAKPDGKQ